MAILSREQIVNRKRELPRETVAVPAWGGEVIVRALTARERDAFEESIVTRKTGAKGKVTIEQNLKNMRAKLCVLAVVDDKGERLFSDAEADTLGNDQAAVVDAIYSVAARLSGISKADEEELTDGKNSGTSPAGSSPSA